MPIVAFSILTGTCMALSYIQSIFTNMLKHNLIHKCLAGSLRDTSTLTSHREKHLTAKLISSQVMHLSIQHTSLLQSQFLILSLQIIVFHSSKISIRWITVLKFSFCYLHSPSIYILCYSLKIKLHKSCELTNKELQETVWLTLKLHKNPIYTIT